MSPAEVTVDIQDEAALQFAADGPQFVITEQVTNDVAVRMAVLERVGRLMARR